MTVRQKFLVLLAVIPSLTVLWAQFWPGAWWLFLIWVPLAIIGLWDMFQTKQTLRRLYPVIGHFRYLLESFRTEIQQYFIETDLSGTPVNREHRALVYQRAKGERDTRPFGTIKDVNGEGYEWMNHSVSPAKIKYYHPRVSIGGKDCKQPYQASLLNISAMSYGSLGHNAIEALNLGAKRGGFAHNTGEGGISPYHMKHGGDLTMQFGSGYFGCRDKDGHFDDELFAKKAGSDQVKMIEIKLSQGAKPGHGGVLPGSKVTPEIAAIRHVEAYKTVESPASHSAFSTPIELLKFVAKVRDLSGGKPVGFKLCLGKKYEFLALCKAMLETNIMPDFITIDGSEGGTGAAPIELTNSVGTPLRDALVYVNNALIGTGLRPHVKIIVAGKIISAFHMIKALALGADTVNSARGMMFALGCIQARVCDTGHCPTGITTQDPARNKGLVVENKADRVARYHRKMLENMIDLLAAAGLCSFDELRPHHIIQRVQGSLVRNYEELYPTLKPGILLDDENRPAMWQADWHQADPNHWHNPQKTK